MLPERAAIVVKKLGSLYYVLVSTRFESVGALLFDTFLVH